MQKSIWIDLIRLIPSKLHDALALVTVTGQELFVQQFYRFDNEVVIMRARLSGSTEGSRVVILPYAHIDYMAITRVLLEPEIQAIFGGGGEMPRAAVETTDTPRDLAAPAAAGAATMGPGVAPMTMGPGALMQTAQLSTRMPALAPAPAPLQNPAASATVPVQANADGSLKAESAEAGNGGPVSKSLLLARLRERLAQKGR